MNAITFKERPKSEVHLAAAARELRHAIAELEGKPEALEVLRIHQRVTKLLHEARS